MKLHLVTLEVEHTAKGLAKACQAHAQGWPVPCAVGPFLVCPFKAKKECEDVTARDWEAITRIKELPEVWIDEDD